MSFLDITTEKPAGNLDGGADVVLLTVSGEIDYGGCPELRACIAEQIDAGRCRLIVDLSEVSFIDSMAIGVLVAAVARLRASGTGSLVAVCARQNERVLRIFDIAGVADVISLYRSRAEALAALAAVWMLEAPTWLERGSARTSPGRSSPPGGPSGLGAARRYAEEAATAPDRPPAGSADGTGGGAVDELA
ncbi:MAG TPA: STAS domain-containing protein [Solirubrobacteraceae bacterium]|nr:STAS domain-containing protein [Solirubrobacteraceae bacterium]